MSVHIYTKGKLVPVTGPSFSTQSTYDDSELRDKVDALTTALQAVVNYLGKIPETSAATTIIDYIEESKEEAQSLAESKVTTGTSEQPTNQSPGDVWIKTI